MYGKHDRAGLHIPRALDERGNRRIAHERLAFAGGR